MTDTSKEAVERLLDGVTPGPWQAESGHTQKNGQLYWQVTDGSDAIVQNQFCWCQGDHKANAHFIAAARELVPALLAEREALTAEVARLTAALEAERAVAEYLVWSHEHGCWWRPNSAGYTNDARAAGTYSRDEAMAISRTGRDGWSEGRKPDELPVRLMDMPDWIIAAHAARREGGV